MNRTIAIIATTMLIAGCGKGEAPRQTVRVQLAGKKLDPKDQNAKVTRMFAVQGRWQGAPDKANHDRFLVIDVAGDSQYNMDMTGMEGGSEAVFASATGTYSWSGSDIMEAHAKDGATGPLEIYDNWQAGFPAEGVMTVRAGSKDVELKKVR